MRARLKCRGSPGEAGQDDPATIQHPSSLWPWLVPKVLSFLQNSWGHYPPTPCVLKDFLSLHSNLLRTGPNKDPWASVHSGCSKYGLEDESQWTLSPLRLYKYSLGEGHCLYSECAHVGGSIAEKQRRTAAALGLGHPVPSPSPPHSPILCFKMFVWCGFLIFNTI